ncbi:MAG: LPS biosynthesis protein PseA [Pelagibacterales bacterium]|nr:LPS biosynthesis protein PseA [Pelagibacterales bacterium]
MEDKKINSNFSLFGLPEKVVHCKKCLMHNQKPYSINESKHTIEKLKDNLKFDEEGVCEACRYSEKKKTIDYSGREKLLLKMLDKYRKDNGEYDCIVSGGGGKDSMSVSHMLKYKYGMHPLTITYSPLLYTDVGWRNMQNWINKGGFDNYLFTPNGKVASILAREALENLYFPLQPFKFGIKSYAMKMAMRLKIDLVMYGEDGTEYGSNNIEQADSPSYDITHYTNDNKDVYIAGRPLKYLLDKHKLEMNDFYPYMPIRSEEVEGSNLRVEHLAWYIKWDPQSAYYYASKNCGFESDVERTDGTYGKYASIDDKFESLHYYTQYIKFMIGRTRFDASQEIRNGHIDKEEAIALAKKYEGEVPKRYLKDCLDFMGLTEKEFVDITDQFRSPHLWKKDKDKWIPIQELSEISNKI